MSDEDREKKPGLWLPEPIAAVLPVTYTKDATLEEMQRQRAEIKQLRDQLDEQNKPLIQQAIARYEREHKQNRKVTFKQICEQMGVNYASARVLKSRYAKQKKKRKKS